MKLTEYPCLGAVFDCDVCFREQKIAAVIRRSAGRIDMICQECIDSILRYAAVAFAAEMVIEAIE